MKLQAKARVAILLAIVGFYLLEFSLSLQSPIFRETERAVETTPWILLISVTVWAGILLLLTFSFRDLPLICLLLIAIIAYAAAARPAMNAIILVFNVALGRGARFFLNSKLGIQNLEMRTFLVGLTVMLALSAWWHLDMTDNDYHGPRWMGLWDSPNTYGMLVGAGVVLACGLLAAHQKAERGKWKTETIMVVVGAGMMAVGLVFSYSRGAWLGTAIGITCLAWNYGKLRWQHLLPSFVILVAAVLYFWGSTSDSAPWYVKRADLGRPSAQHRVTAWRAGLEIMRDHPRGVGWDKAVEVYAQHYAPPEDGALALRTNDYLMIGAQLGIVALLCFVTYISISLCVKCKTENEEGKIQTACRAGALVLVVAFWFDGGLFKLPTAALFWVLLELGAARDGKVDTGELMVHRPKAT